MAAPDYRLPDDFPDLRLPEKSEPANPYGSLVPLPSQTPASQSDAPLVPVESGYWKAGDRVLAPWEPNCLYSGVIVEVANRVAQIQFDDGDAGQVMVESIRSLAVIRAGLKVQSRRKMGLHFHPCEVLQVRGDEVQVAFDNGDDHWVPLAGLRIPCPGAGPGAAPTKVASHLAFRETLAEGDRVWAHWQRGAHFAGTVDRFAGDEAHIHFDDGDRGWVRVEQLWPLEIPVGMRVLARWKMGANFFPGTVAAVNGDRIHIHYDDGDKEWTRHAALVILAEPTGTDARPTKTAFRWGGGASWLIYVGIGIGLAMLRIACR